MFKGQEIPEYRNKLVEIFESICILTTIEFNARIRKKNPDYSEYEARVLCNVYDAIRSKEQTFIPKGKFPEFENWTHEIVEHFRNNDPSETKLREMVKKSWEEAFKN